MNDVFLTGRLVADPDVKTTSNNISYCSFTVAVQRSYTNADGEYEADFIDCKAWRNVAEDLSNKELYRKGTLCVIKGTLQKESYTDKDGKNHSVMKVLVIGITSAETKKKEERKEKPSEVNTTAPVKEDKPSFEVSDSDLPF